MIIKFRYHYLRIIKAVIKQISAATNIPLIVISVCYASIAYVKHKGLILIKLAYYSKYKMGKVITSEAVF
jgi:hypothetical protein